MHVEELKTLRKNHCDIAMMLDKLLPKNVFDEELEKVSELELEKKVIDAIATITVKSQDIIINLLKN